MDELLAGVLDAHGGLESWNRVTKLTARLSLGGPFWAARGWPDVYADQTVTLDAHREHITFAPFTAPDFDENLVQRRMDYSPDVASCPPVAHSTHDPKTFDGFTFPTRRLVHQHDADGIADQSLAGITMDIDTITVERW